MKNSNFVATILLTLIDSYVTCSQTLRFSNDLKLAHYLKIPPRHTFCAQMIATVVSTFVCTGVLNFQMNSIEGVCTVNQKDHYTCPSINQFFTAAVLWGTIGPKKVFGKGGQYTTMLVGFPLGFVIPFVVYYAQKKFPKQTWLRQTHVVVIFYGAIVWAPYNLSYIWPGVPIGYLSMIYMKKRYLGFWSKVSLRPYYLHFVNNTDFADSTTTFFQHPSLRLLRLRQSSSSSHYNSSLSVSIGGEMM
jgi:OPT family oligopeptide transporter